MRHTTRTTGSRCGAPRGMPVPIGASLPEALTPLRTLCGRELTAFRAGMAYGTSR
ncbi:MULTISPECIES: hypothetical protein [unclassified Streptomyces]|uniref:hypothetical protein n=1 Tax=unclassified Streptomyces TaxID=2593676 RepID=UPI0033D58C42